MNIALFHDMGSHMLLNILFRVKGFLTLDTSVGFFCVLADELPIENVMKMRLGTDYMSHHWRDQRNDESDCEPSGEDSTGRWPDIYDKCVLVFYHGE